MTGMGDCRQAKPQKSGLDQDATAKFDPEDVDLINRISRAEGVSPALLAITWRFETVFAMRPDPNTNQLPNKPPTEPTRWDVGPFHINIRWTELAAAKGEISFSGVSRLDAYGFLGWLATEGKTSNVRDNPGWGLGPFDGNPFANGRIAARRLKAIRGSDKDKAMKYAPPDGKIKTRTFRGNMYDKYASAFEKFFDCYRSWW